MEFAVYLVPFGVKLDCLFEIFFASRGRTVLLRTYLLELLLLGSFILDLPAFSSFGLPGGSVGKKSACNVGGLGLIPLLGKSFGEGNGYPPQYSGLENPMDSIVHVGAKSRTQLSNFHIFIWNYCAFI